MQLQDDAGHLVLAAAVDELLRQREVHGDVVVVELAHALRLGAGHGEADDVGRAAAVAASSSRRGAGGLLRPGGRDGVPLRQARRGPRAGRRAVRVRPTARAARRALRDLQRLRTARACARARRRPARVLVVVGEAPVGADAPVPCRARPTRMRSRSEGRRRCRGRSSRRRCRGKLPAMPDQRQGRRHHVDAAARAPDPRR